MSRGILAAIIADDLTGAMDSAAPFVRRGLDVKVITAPAGIGAIGDDLPHVLAISTNTRHVSPEIAVPIVNKTVADLLKHDPELIIKKIDSTLRGNVVPEIVAAMRASGRAEVIVCPAVPAQGRSFIGGEVFINSVVLRDTPVGRDLRSPPPRNPLQDLFRAADPSLPVLATTAGGLSVFSSAREGIYLLDAESGDDLMALVRPVREKLKEVLFAGASGITEALAETLFGPPRLTSAPLRPSGQALFVVGSLAPQAAAQIARLLEANENARVLELTENPAVNRAALQALAASGETFSSLVIKPPCLSEHAVLDAEMLVRELADCTAFYLERARVGLLLATGGDTAEALLARLDLRVVAIGGEVQPGIVHGMVDTPRGPLRLVTKAGGFGDDRLFCTILEYFY